MKCAICKANIETLFLNKVKGTYVWKNGKKFVVCSDCQRRFDLKTIREKL
ncbi:MAG: hypothetical protein J7L39_01285 [Candidatus Aenigmarchaeota archaeon]|nr:hypothetical protein [Candidatus Aenigmarchaeota archaeon]